MKIKYIFLGLVSASQLLAAGLGLLDHDVESFDIKQSSIVKAWEKSEPGKDPKIVFAICKNPEEKFDGDCVKDGITAWLPLSTYRESIYSFLNLKPIDNSKENIKKKEKQIEWLRKKFSEKSEAGELDDEVKEKGEMMLLKMADKVNTSSKEKDKETPKTKMFKKLLSILDTDDPDSVELSDVVFKILEKEEYAAAIHPFAKWVETNICYCRKFEVKVNEKITPAVGLTVGKKVLGWFPSDQDSPLTREGCEKGDWKKLDSAVGGGVQFGEVLTTSCKGYFSLGEPW